MTRSSGGTRVQALLAVLLAGALGASCNPYDRFGKGDDHLGPVNPVNFPAANLGTGGNRMQAGRGVFVEAPAFVAGNTVGYFAYPFPAAVLMSADPLRLAVGDMPTSTLARPPAVVFDPADAAPFPAAYPCQGPGADYRYDPYVDDVPRNEQGPVFTALPSASYTAGVASTTSYVPLVTQLAVSSAGTPCQRWKSETQIDEAVMTMKLPEPAGDRLLAWLIIDPGAGVYPFDMGPDSDHPGIGLQHWGWYNRYLLAYIDGGYVPTVQVDVMGGTMAMPTTMRVTRIRPQRLFYPRSMVMRANGMTAAGARGQGYDVLEGARGTDAYSPVCQVITYDAGMPMAAAALPKDAAAIQAMYGMTFMPAATPYIFCLQVVK
jgi:hypothetical protein